MPISTKAILFAFFLALAIFLMPEMGLCATPGTKIVTRIDTVRAVMKGGTLIVYVEGMAVTPARMGVSGQLLKRGQKLNPDGLLEYELLFNPPQNYSGDKLKKVKATFKDSSVPAGTKGVRIYAEYNEMNEMLPEPKKQEPAPKKQEPVVKKEEFVVAKRENLVAKKEEAAPKKAEQEKTSQWWNPFHHQPVTPQVNATPPVAKKQELAPKKREPVVKKEEAIVTKKEKPILKREELPPKKQEVALKKEEKKNRGWNWNPFHRQPAAAQVNAPPPPATKKEAPVLKKKELVVKKEELAPKKEEVAPKKEEEKKKSRGWNLNPFHRKTTASPTSAMPPEPKKPEPELKKKEPVVRAEESAVMKKENPISKEEAALLKKEEAAPKKEKKSRGWNLNPFHHKPAASPANATPLEPKKEELAPKKKEPVVKKEESVATKKENPVPKKVEAAPPKKEEKKKKSQWWNPFHRKSTEPQNSDEAPR